MRFIALALTVAACSAVDPWTNETACGWEHIEYESDADRGKLAPPAGMCSLVMAGDGLTILPRELDGCSAESGVACAVLMPGESVEIWHRGEWSGEARAETTALDAGGACPMGCP
jgi:hypothetical protein